MMNLRKAFSFFVFFLAITQPAFATDPTPDDYLKFLSRQIYDMVTQSNAFTLLFPEGWRLQTSINSNPILSLAMIHTFTVSSPEGKIGVEYTSAEYLPARSQGSLGMVNG